MSLQIVGKRIYFSGNTYPIKDRIKALGGHWDADRKQWWIGTTKQAEAEALVATLGTETSVAPAAPGERRDEKPSPDARVKARATYKGKDYYVLAETRDGGKLLLAARNGQFQFWVARDLTQIMKQYGREDYRTHRTEYPTLSGLIAKAEKWRGMSADERADAKEDAEARRDGDRCPCSGGACRCGSDSPCCMCW